MLLAILHLIYANVILPAILTDTGASPRPFPCIRIWVNKLFLTDLTTL